MDPFEIHDSAHPFNDCHDRRPWIVVDQRPNGFHGCFPISGQHYDNPHYTLDAEHPDFHTTGLTKTCHILDQLIIEIHANEFLRRRGMLAGEILAGFRAYAGI